MTAPAGATATGASGRTYQKYERQRRLRAATVMGTICSAMFFLAFVVNGAVLLTTQADLAGEVAAEGSLLLATGLCALGVWLARRERLIASALAITIPVFAAILVEHLVWLGQRGIDTYTVGYATAYLIPILLANLLGTWWLMVGVTALTALWTALLFIGAPIVIGGATERAYPVGLLLVLFIGVQIGVMNITLVQSFGARRALRDLDAALAAVDQAKRLDDLKNQFISNVNHELRNPLMALMGYVEMANDHFDRLAPEEVHGMVRQARDAGLAMRRLVQSMLDTRRLDQGAANFTPAAVLVAPVVVEAAKLIDPNDGAATRERKPPERALRVSIAPDLAIWGDRIRLQQILTNLLSNAVKYSAPGTPIEVEGAVVVEASDKRRGASRQMAELRVRDCGHGIPPDQVDLLFNRFVRLPRDLASNVIGNGLGLYLCRALVEAMGGRIWVESAGVEGQGSTFVFRLPLAPAPTSAQPLQRDAQPLAV